MAIKNVNQVHQEQLTGSEKIAVQVTNALGTMFCVYLFIIIGGMSLVGALTNNATLTLTFGAFSSYFLQLVLLPLIMVGQNVQQRHTELRSDNDFEVNLKAEKEIELLHKKIDMLTLAIKKR